MSNASLKQLIQDCIPSKFENEFKRQNIKEKLADWFKDRPYNDWALCLIDFLLRPPFIYFDKEVSREYLNFLENNLSSSLNSLSDLNEIISHAIFSINREGSCWGREEQISLDKPKNILDFERMLHPEYQRYTEHIFNHFINLPLYVLGKNNTKDYLSQTLSNRVETLKRYNLTCLTKGFDSVVRNAISHGKSMFEFDGIKYIDDKEEKTLSSHEFSKLFDQLVDTCNGMLFAILVFLSRNRSNVESFRLSNLPLGIKYLIVNGFVSHPGLRLDSVAESKTVKREFQLNISCYINSLSRIMHIYESLSVALRFVEFGCESYNRFGISIDCGKFLNVAVFINGKELKSAIDSNLSPECSRNIIEDSSLLWYDDNDFRRRLGMLSNMLKSQMKLLKLNLINGWKKIGLKILSSSYTIKTIKNQSAPKIRRLEAYVVLADNQTPSLDMLKDVVIHAIRRLRGKFIHYQDIEKSSFCKFPPSYVWIKLYLRNERTRTLESSGWHNDNLLLQAEWILFIRCNKPIYVKDPDFIYKNVRFKMNPNKKF